MLTGGSWARPIASRPPRPTSPCIDWLSFVGTTAAPAVLQLEKLPGEDPSEHIRRSPLTYVGNVKTPTMLRRAAGTAAPMPQTEQFYSALSSQGANRHAKDEQRVARHQQPRPRTSFARSCNALLVR